jgi:hypothetical protein
MEPINYLAQVADPFAQSLQGLQLGAGMAELQQKQAAMVQQQQRQQLAAQEQAKFFTNPSPTMRDAARYASLLSPEQANAFRPFMEGISKEQQQGTLNSTGRILSALQTNPEIGIKLLQDSATAARNSGDNQDAALFDDMAAAAADPKRGPAIVFKSLAARTAGIPGAKEFFENIDKSLSTARAEAKAPAEQRKAIADADAAEAEAITKLATADNAEDRQAAESDLARAQADKARIEADYQKQITQAELDKSAAVIRKTDADIIINRENARIAALNAAQAKETNVLRRDELRQKIDDAKEKRDTADRDQRATVANQSADVDNFLNTAVRILQTPKNIIESATGPITSRLPTTNQDVADFEALVEALSSQAFIAQIPKIKGTGSLSEKEGDKLQASLQTLSLKQSPARLVENVTEAVRLLTKVRENISLKYGVQAPPLDVPAKQEVFVPLPDGTRIKFPNQAAADAYKKAAGIK